MTLTLNDLRDVVRHADATKPRSTQTAIGPSDAGTECARRLGHKIAGTPPVNTAGDPWAAIVGTAVHAWLDTAFTGDRWVTDRRVTLPGYMTGTLDLYDTETNTVIDHKIVGATSLKRVRDHGPSKQYVAQVNLYAAALEVAGVPVEHVAIAYWSRSGNLRDAHLWTGPYDRDIVNQTLARLDAIRTIVHADGVTSLPTADSHCLFCPHYLPAATVLTEACPGHNPTQPK